MAKLELLPPNHNLIKSYFDFIKEMEVLGEKVWEGNMPKPYEPPEEFVNRLNRAETKPEPGLVPETIYWAVQDNQVVGRIALRHILNDNLREFGGHIGYEVRPSSRRMGVATEMLKQILETPKAREIGRVLLTCAPDNIGSNRTILSNGGVLEKTVFVKKWERETNYYWIEVKRT
jgi:predicted acetyltransferase